MRRKRPGGIELAGMEIGMLRRALHGPAPFLEIEIGSENLSIPAGAVLADSAQCAICSRMPLVGEQVTIHSDGSADHFACDMCIDKPACTSLGEPLRRERVRTTGGAQNVRRLP